MLVSGSQSTRFWEKLSTLLGFGPHVARLVTLTCRIGILAWSPPASAWSLVALDLRVTRPRQIIVAVGPLS